MRHFQKLLIYIFITVIQYNSFGKVSPTEESVDNRLADEVKWKHYSTVNADMQVPNEGSQQTAALVLDIDKDGINDFVITERTHSPSVTWYKFNNYNPLCELNNCI